MSDIPRDGTTIYLNNETTGALEHVLTDAELAPMLRVCLVIVDPAYWQQHHEDGAITCLYCYAPHTEDCPVAIAQGVIERSRPTESDRADYAYGFGLEESK